MTRAEGLEEAGATEFLFDVDLMARMHDLNLFGPESKRIELRAGRLIKMAPIGLDRARATPKLMYALIDLLRQLGRTDLEVVEGTLVLSPQEAPTPDAAVVSGGASGPYFKAEHALLAVEVAKSSLSDDLTDKRDAYARANVSEYWVIDLINRKLHLFRGPRSGIYSEEGVLNVGDCISPLFADGRAEIAVADLFS